MHNGYFNNGMDNGWQWIPMMAIMIVFVVGLVWLGVTFIKRTNHPVPAAPAGPAPLAARTPQEILAERLATGQIDPEDYQQRLRALQGPSDR